MTNVKLDNYIFIEDISIYYPQEYPRLPSDIKFRVAISSDWQNPKSACAKVGSKDKLIILNKDYNKVVPKYEQAFVLWHEIGHIRTWLDYLRYINIKPFKIDYTDNSTFRNSLFKYINTYDNLDIGEYFAECYTINKLGLSYAEYLVLRNGRGPGLTYSTYTDIFKFMNWRII
jgi:hypothetical protein